MSVFDPKICQDGHTDRTQCLEAERDKLKEKLDYATNLLASRAIEIDTLKAELGEMKTYKIVRRGFSSDLKAMSPAIELLQKDRDLWKSKAEKLAKAFKNICGTQFQQTSKKIAEEALSEFEKVTS